MNAEEMSPEQLMELARAKSGAMPPETRTIEVDGLTVTIDGAKVMSWPAWRIASKVTGEVSVETVDAMMQFVALVSDVDEAAIVAHHGGDSAPIEDVIGTAARILEACYPKN